MAEPSDEQREATPAEYIRAVLTSDQMSIPASFAQMHVKSLKWLALADRALENRQKAEQGWELDEDGTT